MIAQIDFELKKAGYQYISVKPKEAGVYYKIENATIYALIGVADHKDFVTNAKQLEAIQMRVRELFLNPYGKIENFPRDMIVTQVFTHMLIVTNRLFYYKEAAQQVKGVWIVDEQSRKLVIYENQPGNFYGLKEKIEKILFSNPKRMDKEEENQERNQKQNQKQNLKNKSLKNTFFDPSKKMAWITIGIIIINFLVFLVTSILGDTTNARFLLDHGGLYLPAVFIGGQWYRLLTSMFLHSGFLHILNNMFILYFTGEILELEIGKIKYCVIYLISGIGGGLLSLLVAYLSQNYVVSVGASGAIFGIIGGLLWIVIAHRGRYKELTSYRMLIMIVLILFIGFTSSQIDNWGHIGGLVSGFLTTVLLYHRKKVLSR